MQRTRTARRRTERACCSSGCTWWSCAIFLSLFISITLCTLVDARLTAASSEGRTLTVPTYDYYGVDPPAYNITGRLLRPTFVPKEACLLQHGDQGDLNSIKNSAQSKGPPVVSFSWAEAGAAQCHTFAQAALAVVNYGRLLATEGVSAPSLFLLLLTNEHYKMYSGSPYTEPYTADNLSVTDKRPSIITVLVPADHTKEVGDFLNGTGTNGAVVIAEKEAGPWNDVILSSAYVGFSITFFVLNILFLLYGIFQLGRSVYAKEFKLDQRNSVFLASLITSICGVPFFLMSHAELREQLLRMTASFILTICSYSLLLLWCSVLAAIQQERRPILLIIVTFLAMVVRTATFGVQMWATVGRPYFGAVNAIVIIGYLVPAFQLCMCCLFIYHSHVFLRQRRQMAVSEQTAAPLLQLSYVAIATFIGFFFLAIDMLLSVTMRLDTTPTVNALRYQMKMVAWTIQSGALIILLGMRTTSKTSILSLMTGSVLSKTHTPPWPWKQIDDHRISARQVGGHV
ncbi:hypothetical protein THASP1DRAFT_29295 [Thamnocephalis sphaerospora]|uniref:Uncharacterized protein n=1 Tax=Thamnocephalis sphaerospora TaxID=78915 RepID=A0A4P9XS21_9FUNG|nr:hypothetical protein THASP1DRAFT_29295 [Thamnocephalis sphaerospora]|eukprot:RKP08907.1 hypothetical protein THASP1DRAFT_29295 [Thamnocephalis sphaerospora]